MTISLSWLKRPSSCKFNVEIKSEGEYFMTSIKGRYFRRIMDERGAQPLSNVPTNY